MFILLGTSPTNQHFWDVLINHLFEMIFSKARNDKCWVDSRWIIFGYCLHSLIFHWSTISQTLLFDWVELLGLEVMDFLWWNTFDYVNFGPNFRSEQSAFKDKSSKKMAIAVEIAIKSLACCWAFVCYSDVEGFSAKGSRKTNPDSDHNYIDVK